MADGLSDYLAGVQERAPGSRTRASGGGGAEPSRSVGGAEVQLALAASVLAFTTLGGLSTTYFLQQRAERARLMVEQAAAV